MLYAHCLESTVLVTPLREKCSSFHFVEKPLRLKLRILPGLQGGTRVGIFNPDAVVPDPQAGLPAPHSLWWDTVS